MRPSLGPVALLAVAVTFLLPFMELSCQKKPVLTFTGYETAFGKEVKAELPVGKWLREASNGNASISFDIEQRNRTEGRPLVAAALFVAVLGGAAAFFKRPVGAVSGLAACVLLLVAQSQMQSEIQERQVPLILLTFQYGFWASLVCAAAGGVLCLLRGRKV